MVFMEKFVIKKQSFCNIPVMLRLYNKGELTPSFYIYR